MPSVQAKQQWAWPAPAPRKRPHARNKQPDRLRQRLRPPGARLGEPASSLICRRGHAFEPTIATPCRP
eukprot:1565353-Lingulodinium_polyedra.AAC.1